jgi:hypothetical protein
MPDARDLEADLQFDIFYFLKNSKFAGRKSGNWFEDEPVQREMAHALVEKKLDGWIFAHRPPIPHHTSP